MNGHPTREEDFDLYALGALEAEERKTLEVHLAICPECARKMEVARGRIALLALAAPPQAPPAAIKDRLMQQIAQSPSAPRARISAQDYVPGRAPFWSGWVAAWAAAVVVLIIAALFLWVENNRMSRELVHLQAETSRLTVEAARNRVMVELLNAGDTIQVSLAPASCMNMHGRVMYSRLQGSLIFMGNLPALPADKTYQLWLVPAEGNPISAGIFNSDAAGKATVVLASMSSHVTAKAFAVTVEPAGGKPQPTGDKVLIGAVS